MNDKIKFLERNYGLKEPVITDFIRKIPNKRELGWWTNREKELSEWLKIIDMTEAISKNFIVFIIGSYGRGKTLSLLKVKEEAEKNMSIYSSYLNFKAEEKSKPGLDFIFRIFKNINFNEIESRKSREDLNNCINMIPGIFKEPKEILTKILKIKSISLFKDFSEESTSKLRDLALYFLRGEKSPTSTELKKLGIIRKIDNIDVAKEYLAAILFFIKEIGYNSLLLAIDEFEYLFSLVPKSQRSIYLGLLRGLYDFPTGLEIEKDKIANIVFFIGISEAGWTSLQEMEKKEASIGGPVVPLLERIDSKTTLGVFSEEQTEELIKKVLCFNRKEGMFKDEPLIPFTQDFVHYVYLKTNGEPRAIKNKCGHVLYAGLDEKVKLLDKKYARKILSERGF